MPVAWKDVWPATQADSSLSTTSFAECAHRVHLTLRHIAHTVGVEGDDLVRILGGRNADGADAAHVADVAVGLGVEVDEGTDEVEIGVLVRSMLIGLR
jgi:hypothetical protein